MYRAAEDLSFDLCTKLQARISLCESKISDLEIDVSGF